jgi:redox-sensitive bicupin YhaK (pirin superfamily)
MHGFQLWVNLPATDKLMEPRYQEIPSAGLPTASSPDGKARVKVIAGEALGVRAVIETRTPILYHDWTLAPGARVAVSVPEDFDVMASVFSGRALAGEDARPLDEGDFAAFEGAGDVVLGAPSDAASDARVLLLGGVPLREPVARYGPFVMNTDLEIRQAFVDYRFGKMGQITRAR